MFLKSPRGETTGDYSKFTLSEQKKNKITLSEKKSKVTLSEKLMSR